MDDTQSTVPDEHTGTINAAEEIADFEFTPLSTGDTEGTEEKILILGSVACR